MEIRKCEYGCGLEAKHQTKSGKWCCSVHYSKCPAVRERNSKGGGRSWANGRKLRPKSGKAWNKGLTKETDPRVAKIVNTFHQKMLNGYVSPLKGRKLIESVIQKLKETGGGLRHGAGRGKKGWYKGFWCDSSWELAWVIFHLEHDVKFERNKQAFQYEFEGKIHKYFPDFKMEDGTFIEIKGFHSEKSKSKMSQFKGNIRMLFYKEMVPYLNYARERCGVEQR